MTVRLRHLLVLPAAATATVVLATAALASTTISITSSQVPTTASAFDEHSDCSFPDHPSQSPPLWGWHFVLPGGTATFDTLTAHFATAGTVTLPGPSGYFVQDGKGAVVYTLTDDTLTGAEATIEGSTPQGDFVLSHTCPPTPSSASASGTPSETGTPSGTGTPSASVSATGTASETPSAEVSGTELSRTPSASSLAASVLGVKLTKGGVAGTGLPTTGVSALGLLALAGVLVGIGTALVSRPKGRYAR
jgi:hypothetical protein